MKDLPEPACKAFLGSHRVGVMALARGGDAYAVPLFFAYDGHALYFHSHPGAKEAFLEGTKAGCFMVYEMQGQDDWTSVQAIGPVTKIASNADAERAMRAIAGNPFPPEFGIDHLGNPRRSPDRSFLWMMTPSAITGRTSRSLVRLKGEP